MGKCAHGRLVWRASIVRRRRLRCPEAEPIRQHACVRIVRRAARTGAQWDASAAIKAFVAYDHSTQAGWLRAGVRKVTVELVVPAFFSGDIRLSADDAAPFQRSAAA